MRYVKTVGEAIVYPYTLEQMRKDNPQVSFPMEPSPELLAEFGVHPVTLTPQPASTLTQDPVELPPQKMDHAWVQVWSMVDVLSEEAARRQQKVDYVTTRESIKADAFVKSFLAMTPAQVTEYVNANTANLAQTRALLNKLALMLLILARNEYH